LLAAPPAGQNRFAKLSLTMAGASRQHVPEVAGSSRIVRLGRRSRCGNQLGEHLGRGRIVVIDRRAVTGRIISARHDPGRIDAVVTDDGDNDLEGRTRRVFVERRVQRELTHAKLVREVAKTPAIMTGQSTESSGNGDGVEVCHHPAEAPCLAAANDAPDTAASSDYAPHSVV
jgi:hypothetical protein